MEAPYPAGPRWAIARSRSFMKCRFVPAALLAIAILAIGGRMAQAQGYGTDVQNVLGPASGGMAGVSIAMPQDVPSAIFGNPATLAQFKGTQFCFGGAWVEGYPTISNDGSINGGTPFSVTSRTQGFALPEVGVTQDLRSVGVNGAFGLGLSGLSGLGAEYLNAAPGTILNNVNAQYLVLGITPAVGVQLNQTASCIRSGRRPRWGSGSSNLASSARSSAGRWFTTTGSAAPLGPTMP